jgi:hypothetical protein
MHLRKVFPSALALAITSHLPLASATCQNWTPTQLKNSDTIDAFDDSGQSVQWTIDVDKIPCAQPTNCTVPTKSYSITVQPNIGQNGIASYGYNITSPSDTDSLFKLAQSASGEENGTDYSQVPFSARNYSITWGPPFDLPDDVPGISPRYTRVLQWVPFMRMQFGNASGCGNSSIDGRTLLVAAPYVDSSNATNAGVWTFKDRYSDDLVISSSSTTAPASSTGGPSASGTGSPTTTGTGKSGANILRGGKFSSTLFGLIVVALW